MEIINGRQKEKQCFTQTHESCFEEHYFPKSYKTKPDELNPVELLAE